MRHLDPEVLSLAKSRRGPYLAALSAPKDKLSALLAVVAFDAELSRIPSQVSEPMLGRIRLQWWVDALPGVTKGRPPSHPVARALAPVGLGLEDLRALAEAHLFELDGDAAKVEEIAAYAEARGGALARLMADCLGVADASAREAAHAAGQAWILAEALADGRRVASGEDADILRGQVQELLRQAHVPSIAKGQRRAALPVLLLARLAQRVLARPGQPLAASLGAGAVLGLWWCSLSGRF